jgi:hypothetical protein
MSRPLLPAGRMHRLPQLDGISFGIVNACKATVRIGRGVHLHRDTRCLNRSFSRIALIPGSAAARNSSALAVLSHSTGSNLRSTFSLHCLGESLLDSSPETEDDAPRRIWSLCDIMNRFNAGEVFAALKHCLAITVPYGNVLAYPDGGWIETPLSESAMPS